MYSALIIDADGKTPATLKSILAPYGFEFTITENGPEAVNVARQAAPDIIFLRAELPLTSGFSVCNRLRRHEDTKKTPLIMYSSNVSEDVFEQHRNLKTHADEYLRLPLEAERLLAAIRPLLSLQEPSKEPSKVQPPPAPERSSSGPARAARPKDTRGRLDVELADAPPPPRQPEPRQQFEQDFSDGFRQLQDEPAAAPPAPPAPAAVAAAAARPAEAPPPDAEASDASIQAGGFKAQREVLQIKSQLNAKAREILALKDDLEARERTILDAKRHQRELQAQLSELESQLLTAQEQILSSREAAEAASRDKQTALKREEGVKTRLEVTQKKLKDLEAESTNFRAQATQEQARLGGLLAEAQQRIETQSSLISDLEGERDLLAGQLAEANQQIARLVDGFESARKTITGLEDTLAETRKQGEEDLADARARAEKALADARAERAAAIESLSAQHQAEIDERDQDHAATVKELQNQQAALREQAQQERERMSQVLMETEENARLQIDQLTQTLAATEETARREIEQLRATLAQAEETARNEIAALQAAMAEAKAQAEEAAAEAARRISALEREVDELGGHLDRAESNIARRKDLAARAQQALAVALKLLEEDEP